MDQEFLDKFINTKRNKKIVLEKDRIVAIIKTNLCPEVINEPW